MPETPKIGGTLFTHNCIEYDYCFREALESLLPVCDEVVVVDAQSDDGTFEALIEMEKKHEKLRVHSRLWNPSRGGAWLADLTNEARNLLKSPYHVNLQADEVIHEDDYDTIRQCARDNVSGVCERFNFWYDHRRTTRPWTCCGHRITRCAPVGAPSLKDAESLSRDFAPIRETSIRIFHYGFIREPKALARKGKAMQIGFFGKYDPIWDDVEIRGREALIDPAHSTGRPLATLPEYRGPHPKVAHGWLAERGFAL